ncbi:hypothetical protein VTO42DRAFT_2829 [Malbranchea cinnamomea]
MAPSHPRIVKPHVGCSWLGTWATLTTPSHSGVVKLSSLARLAARFMGHHQTRQQSICICLPAYRKNHEHDTTRPPHHRPLWTFTQINVRRLPHKVRAWLKYFMACTSTPFFFLSAIKPSAMMRNIAHSRFATPVHACSVRLLAGHHH